MSGFGNFFFDKKEYRELRMKVFGCEDKELKIKKCGYEDNELKIKKCDEDEGYYWDKREGSSDIKGGCHCNLHELISNIEWELSQYVYTNDERYITMNNQKNKEEFIRYLKYTIKKIKKL